SCICTRAILRGRVADVVTLLLRVDAVQAGVNPLGQGVADAFDLRDVLDRSGLQSRQSTEVAQQIAAPARADAGDVLEPAHAARLLPAPAVAGDGEAVGLVAHLLDELQARRTRAGADLSAVGEQQGFLARPALGSLGHADDGHIGHASLR